MGREKELKAPKYIMLSLDEVTRLIICMALDVVEYAIPILLGPVVGDVLDIIGIGIGALMFGLVGILSVLEFLPMADVFPIFVFTWFVWYYLKKRKEKREREKLRERWT